MKMAKLVPEVFDFLPATFDPNFKNPCWAVGGGLRCLPYFHVLGVSKCGTTDLYRRLAIHGDVAKSINKGGTAMEFVKVTVG